jgi:hypothetical protein
MKIDLSKLGITPGPWKLEDYTVKNIISKPNEGYISRDIIRLDSSTHSAFNQQANAKAITATPEMLEDLIWFCLRVERGEVRSRRTYERFVSRIEKATGLPWPEVKTKLGV